MDFSSKELLLIFTYAPAGFGHLRVTDALYDGLLKNPSSVILGADDKSSTTLHRIMSITPVTRKIMEWFQDGWRLEWFSRVYTFYLRKTTKHIYEQLKSLIKEQRDQKRIVVVVSTHFGLAHQIAVVKEKLEKDAGVKLILVVQVTDATPMSIWYVKGADIIFVPSNKVREELSLYAEKKGNLKTKIEFSPYPLSGILSKYLSEEGFTKRVNQLSADKEAGINIAMPISGAAVGLTYYEKLTRNLKKISERYNLEFVARRNIHTAIFIKKLNRLKNVNVTSNLLDRDVVNSYEKLYDDKIISLEVVKPSEQSFKALLTPRQHGGSILLFTEAVGKQEKDNLDFLASHNLLPNLNDQYLIWNAGLSNNISGDEINTLRTKAPLWRALRLTNDPNKDAKIINWCLTAGIFKNMAKYSKNIGDKKINELDSDGVSQFWKRVENLIINIS